MKEPTKKQARTYLVKKLIDDIRADETKLSDKKLALNMLMSGNLDEDIEIKDYKNESWHLDISLKGIDLSIWDFVEKTRLVNKKMPRF